MELYCLDIITGKRRGVIPFFVKAVLRTLSWGYRFGVFCRNWAFDHNWLRRYFPPVPVVVSVGNIVAGGTGKTPVTLMLSKQFYPKFPIAILTRGYRSPAEHLSSPITLSKGEGPLYPASYCGDEPYLLASQLPRGFVFVGKDRRKASMLASKAGAKLILLDDGLQYRYLARDFEVIVIDASDPFGRGYFLPRGFLRENLKALARADLLFVNNIKERAQYLTLKHQLGRYSKASIVATQPVLASIQDRQGKEITSLKEVRIGMFCGIAQPSHFIHLLNQQGALVVAEYTSPDHVIPDPQALRRFAEHCQSLGAAYVVCTEKDWVKLSDTITTSIPIVCVKMKLMLIEGHQEWETFLEKIKTKLEK